MRHNYLQGEKVYLRAMEPEDLELLYTMENDSATWDISNFTVPYSRYALKQYIADSQSDVFADRQLRLIIALCENDEAVGTIDLFDFTPMHMRAEVGISLKKAHQQQGYGAEALSLLQHYAFTFLNLHQLTARVLQKNQAALRLFLGEGFSECGLLKAWWRIEEQYEDVILLQKMRS